MPYQDELDIALKAARAAADIQLEHLYKDKDIEIKSDQSPVSNIDKTCEDLIIDMLHTAFPEDGFLGEETGATEGTSGRTWIIDPLDGTRPYLKQIPTYSVLIALVENNESVVGVMHLPSLNEVYYASKGMGAYCNATTIRVSRVSSLDQAYGSAYGHIPKLQDPKAQAVLKQMQQWRFASGFMDAYTYGCIASGKLDICLNLSDKPWDCAPAACIIKEAGGRFSDIDGNESIYNGSFIISNGLLHDEAIANLSGKLIS
jgi:histidinol phosphatase-like enzyme (inositol monophosphatase family)